MRHSDKALGPAKQILPDDHFKQRSNLGASYKQCTQVDGAAWTGRARWF